MTAQVTNTPIVTRLMTTRLISFNSENLRFIPPSNNITATQTETTGRSISPNILSGSINPVTGPATNPEARSSRIAGILRRQETQ